MNIKGRNSGYGKTFLFCLLLALLVAFSCAATAEEETIVEDISDQLLISNPLPIDFTGGYAPQADGYKGELVYEDPTIRVSIEYKDASAYIHGYRGRDAGYWVVDVEIGDASQLRTASAFSFDSDSTKPIEAMAEEVNAVVAFNGDYVTRLNEGLIIRQGKTFRDRLKGKRDVLLIDEDGDFHTILAEEHPEDMDKTQINGKKVVNALCFGPALIKDGKKNANLDTAPLYSNPDKYKERLVLCQIGHLEYLVVACGVRRGVTLTEMTDLILGLGLDVQQAYNLDGGMSTQILFLGRRINNTSRTSEDSRKLVDIVYFASAYRPDPQ